MTVELLSRLHKSAFLKWMGSDESSKAFVSRSAPSYSSNEELFEQLVSMTKQHGFFAWVKLNDQGKIIAYAELKQSSKVLDDELELIYVVSEESRGKGIAKGLVREILTSEACSCKEKIVAYVGAASWASRKVLLNNGFLEVPSLCGGIRYESRMHLQLSTLTQS